MFSPLTLSADTAGFSIALPEPLPVARFLIGKPVEEAAALMPRLFNLCAMAQDMAFRVALDLPLAPGAQRRLTLDILREHLIRFFVMLPPLLDLKPRALPKGWDHDPKALRCEVFGCGLSVPESLRDLKRWLARDEGLAPVIAALGARFLPGEATAHLPLPSEAGDFFRPVAIENSLAARHHAHPLMQEIALKFGHGPLWRAVARLLDLEACFEGRLPKPDRPGPGRALVPAARGTYALRAAAKAGVLTRLERVTPTDHLLAEGGVLRRTLDTLPMVRHGEVQLVTALLDPCVPVSLSPTNILPREAAHA